MKITRAQLRSIIKESLNEQAGSGMAVELMQSPDKAAVSAAWPDGVNHNGQNVFRTFYELPGRGVNDAEDWISREGYEDGQESYLGYDPDSDNFVMGFDAFEQSYDEYGNADNDGMMDGVIVLLSPEGRALETITAVPGGMYPEGLRAVKKAMPQIIDIRLD